MKESRSSPRKIEAAERRIQALDLRKAGLTYQAIADRLGFKSPASAKKTVDTALDEMREIYREQAEQLIELECQRLDRLLQGLWLKAAGGNPRAVEAALKIMERRARLLGLDSAQKKELSGPGGQPLLDLTTALQALTQFEEAGNAAPEDEEDDA